MPVTNGGKPLVGVSACLLGRNVRYDGGHQHDRYLTGTLSHYLDFLPVCPEVESGMPIPREAMRLVGDVDSHRLLGRSSGTDFTQQMTTYASRRAQELTAEPLAGFIFKAKSPSSGMERVKIYPPEGGMAKPVGVGLFAKAFMQANPLVPAEDDGRLHDPRLRENFIDRVFVRHRWLNFAAEPSLAGLMDFHARHKLILMAHSPKTVSHLGNMVANASQQPLEDVLDAYAQGFTAALKLAATVRKHVNVLQHALGYFKKDLSPDEKAEFLDLLDDFRGGQVPLIVPVTLLNHFVRKYGKDYLAQQYYLRPHPLHLRLRSAL